MKSARAERNVFAQLVLLALKNDTDLEMTMSYQLGKVPWTLATADGSPVKSDKAKLLHDLKGTAEASEKPVQEETFYIYDGNTLLQAMTAIPDTFEKVAERAFTLLPKTQRVDFATDSYYEHSIKVSERRRHGMLPLIPSGRNGQNGALGPELPENILSKSVNGKGIHPGPKHLSHGLNSIEPQRGRVGKV